MSDDRKKRKKGSGRTPAKGAKRVDRREFLVKSTQLFAAAALGSACTEDGLAADGEGGSVTVRVLGLNGSEGGTVVARYEDGGATGVPEISMPAPDSFGISERTEGGIPADRYRLVYSAPANHTIVDPVAIAGEHFRIVGVEPNGEANANFTVQPNVTPPVGLVFASDWGTTTGINGVADGGKWTAAQPDAELSTVIANPGNLEFPSTMANLLAIRYRGGAARGAIADGRWTAPNVGEDIFYRFYFRSGVSGDMVQSNHPVGSRPDLGAFAMIITAPTSDEMDRFWFGSSDGSNFNNNRRWATNGIFRHETYRMEVHIRRLSLATMNWHIRIYNSAGALYKQDRDFVDQFHPADSLDENPIITVQQSAMASLGNMFISHQGLWQNTNDASNRCYYGGFAVSRSDWCGPYVRGEGPGAG